MATVQNISLNLAIHFQRCFFVFVCVCVLGDIYFTGEFHWLIRLGLAHYGSEGFYVLVQFLSTEQAIEFSSI